MIPEVPAVTISFWRLAIASCILWGYSSFKPQGEMTPGDRNPSRLAGLFLGLHFICFFGALKYTSVANATLLATTAPFFTVIFERLVLKRKWNRNIIGGLLLAFLGLIIIQGNSAADFTENRVGNLLALLSSIWMAIVMLLSEQVRKKTGVINYTRMMYLTASLVLLALSTTMRIPLQPPEASAYLWLALLGIVPTVFGHTLFYYSVKYIRPTIVSAVPLGEPVLASGMAFFFFREILSLPVILGGIITLTGIYILVTKHS